ncbi:uncharacterized mitochondrial protein-like protein [Tanacetum coccineum]
MEVGTKSWMERGKGERVGEWEWGMPIKATFRSGVGHSLKRQYCLYMCLVTTKEKAQKKNDVKARKDLNLKFLRSLPSEWNTHVVVWRNKPDLDTMSFDDLYNNFKILKQSILWASQPNGSQLVYEDLEQIHEDDIEEMDLKWQLALLSMRTRRGPKNQDNINRNQDSSKRTVNVEETSSKATMAIDGVGFDWSYMVDDEVPTNMALMDFSTLRIEFNKSEFNSATYKRGLESVEEQLVFYKNNEGHLQKEDQGYVDSGCSRHMTWNMSYISDFKEFDKGYVTFGGRSQRRENYCVLFTDTRCFVLSSNFKLADESHVLLKVHRKNNMYIVDMKNIVPKESLTLSAESNTKPLHLRIETSGILKNFITEIENLVDKKVKIIRCDNGTEFKNRIMSKFDRKSDEGFFVRYSLNSKAFRVYNIKTRKVEENLHIRFLEDKPIIIGIEESIVQNSSNEIPQPSSDCWKEVYDKVSGVLTRRMTKTINKQRFISVVYEGKSHEDLHTCLLACRPTSRNLCTEFKKLKHKKFQMSSMGELTFFLGLQVTQNDDGIFISQDKYVDEILKKFGFLTVKPASTPMETLKPLLMDAKAEDVDVHLYRSMIGSLMYLTSSGPDIMFAVCAYARFKVTPKVSHLHAVKRIFRYLKGQPKLGLWYHKDSSFDLEAFSDSDYAGASLDRKSTTGGF